MKIIMAGYPKTGTKSMTAALKELGYVVYDFGEHLQFHRKEWMRIMNKGGSVKEFRNMYENGDVGCGSPFMCHWYEVHQAFPDAKIILTIRNEDEVVSSMTGLALIAYGSGNYLFKLLQTITPTGRQFFRFIRDIYRIANTWNVTSPWGPISLNEPAFRRMYRSHNQDVLHNAPKDKLLVFNVTEGWEKLCKFLDKEIPDKPFPHENICGSIVNELMTTHPTFNKMKQEALFIVAIVLPILLLLIYILMTVQCQ